MPKKGGKEAGKPHPPTAASTTRRVRPSASARSVVAAVARKVADFFLLFFNLFSTPPHPTPNFPKQQIVSLFLVLALVLATAVSASPANVYPARLRRSLFADEV